MAEPLGWGSLRGFLEEVTVSQVKEGVDKSVQVGGIVCRKGASLCA